MEWIHADARDRLKKSENDKKWGSKDYWLGYIEGLNFTLNVLEKPCTCITNEK